MDIVKLIVGLAIGGLCGFAANKLMKGSSKGILWNIVLGVIGGAVGGYLGGLIGIGGGWVTGILLAIAGSCLVVWVAGKLAK